MIDLDELVKQANRLIKSNPSLSFREAAKQAMHQAGLEQKETVLRAIEARSQTGFIVQKNSRNRDSLQRSMR